MAPLSLVAAVLLVGAVQAQAPPLLEAAKGRDWAEVRALVRDGANVDAAAPDGSTALHWASYWDEGEIAELLMRAGADPSVANDLGATPLWNAGLNGSAGMTRSLLASGADPGVALLSGETPVMTAARTGNPEVVELLLAAGADPNVRGPRGQTALMWAASQEHPQAVRVLLAHGADPLARSDEWSQVMAIPPHSDPANQQNVPHGGNTALLFAARVGDVASARLLVQAGAERDATDAAGTTALVLAAHSGFGDLVEYLLGEGANPDLADAGFAAIHLAVFRRDEQMARVLLAHGADPEARLTNWTPTRRASSDWSIHPSLIGATPFWLAARFGHPGLMRLLADNGADPRFVHRVRFVGLAGSFGAEEREEATTTLMAAAGMGGPRSVGGFVDPAPSDVSALRLEAVKLALEFGEDISAVDLDGRTAAEGARDPAVGEFLAGLTAPEQLDP